MVLSDYFDPEDLKKILSANRSGNSVKLRFREGISEADKRRIKKTLRDAGWTVTEV